MSKDIISEQLRIYSGNYSKFGVTPKGVRNNNEESQYLRFARILNSFNLSKPFSIHDIGCGTCALHKYLLNKKTQHVYYGSEIVNDMVIDSQKTYPEAKLFIRDILKTGKIEKCNIVVSSGTFYIKGKTSKKAWEKYVYSTIMKMFEISTTGISFNMLTSYNTFESTELAYFSPLKVLDFCINNLSRYTYIDNAYPLYEFTVTVLQQKHIQAEFRDKSFAKYFKNDK
jgi:hypothetical protein